MTLVRAANNLSLTAKNGTDAIIRTDPYAPGGMNYGDVMANVEVLDGTGGTPTLDIQAEASNDGQTFTSLGALSLTGVTALGLSEAHGSVVSAYIRFKITLKSVGGAGGDLAWTTLDLHVNYTHT